MLLIFGQGGDFQSLAYQDLLVELDLGWLGEYRDQASGIEKSLTATAVT